MSSQVCFQEFFTILRGSRCNHFFRINVFKVCILHDSNLVGKYTRLYASVMVSFGHNNVYRQVNVLVMIHYDCISLELHYMHMDTLYTQMLR